MDQSDPYGLASGLPQEATIRAFGEKPLPRDRSLFVGSYRGGHFNRHRAANRIEIEVLAASSAPALHPDIAARHGRNGAHHYDVDVNSVRSSFPQARLFRVFWCSDLGRETICDVPIEAAGDLLCTRLADRKVRVWGEVRRPLGP